MDHPITPEQVDALVQFAAKRLHMSPEQLAGTVQQQGLEGLASQLPAEEAAHLKDVKFDRSQAEQLLQSPQVQALLRQLSGGETP